METVGLIESDEFRGGRGVFALELCDDMGYKKDWEVAICRQLSFFNVKIAKTEARNQAAVDRFHTWIIQAT